MNDMPIKKEYEGKSDDNFFSFSSSNTSKSAKTTQTPTKKHETETTTAKIVNKDKKEPQKSDPLKAGPKNAGSPVLDLSSSKFTMPNPIFIKKKNFSQNRKIKSDTIGSTTTKKVEHYQTKTPPKHQDRYHEPIEETDTPTPTSSNKEASHREEIFTQKPNVFHKEEKTRPERPDKYHEPIEESVAPEVKELEEDADSVKRLSEVGRRIQQIESAMPESYIPETHDTKPEVLTKKVAPNEIDSVKVVNKEDANKAVEEILGYAEMIGGATLNGKQIPPEEIAAMSADLFLGKPETNISQIPTESGVQALVRRFAEELGIALK